VLQDGAHGANFAVDLTPGETLAPALVAKRDHVLGGDGGDQAATKVAGELGDVLFVEARPSGVNLVFDASHDCAARAKAGGSLRVLRTAPKAALARVAFSAVSISSATRLMVVCVLLQICRFSNWKRIQ
jgi:hypothetical protein